MSHDAPVSPVRYNYGRLPLPGTSRLVKIAPIRRAARGSRLPCRIQGLLMMVFACAVPVRKAAAQAQSVSEIQVTPETMTLGVGQKQALFAAAFDGRGNLI